MNHTTALQLAFSKLAHSNPIDTYEATLRGAQTAATEGERAAYQSKLQGLKARADAFRAQGGAGVSAADYQHVQGGVNSDPNAGAGPKPAPAAAGGSRFGSNLNETFANARSAMNRGGQATQDMMDRGAQAVRGAVNTGTQAVKNFGSDVAAGGNVTGGQIWSGLKNTATNAAQKGMAGIKSIPSMDYKDMLPAAKGLATNGLKAALPAAGSLLRGSVVGDVNEFL